MTSHKRKASQELRRISVSLESAAETSYMRNLFLWSWWADVCKRWLAPITPSNMPSASSEVVPDTHVQLHRQKEDGATSLKRQKIRRTKSARSISAVDERRKAGRGKLDIAGCVTENDCQKRIDDFFAPPELGFGRNSTLKSLRTPEPSAASSDEENNQGYLRRRHSHEIMSSRSPESMSPFRSPDPSPTAYKVARIPRTPELPYATNAQPSKTSDEVDITKRLEGLLVTPEEDHDQGSSLGLSTFMRGRLAKQAKEREAKERAEALHAAKERRLIRRNPLRPLVQPLSQKWDEIVFNAQYELSPQRVLAKAIKGTELHKKDFLTLLGHHAWLNDEIINAYLEWIEDAANKAANAEAEAAGERPSDVPKFIAHNSFFYETLKSKGPNQTERLMKRRKAPGKSFMQVDTMFVPINSGNHWTVAVVRPIAKTIEFFDSMGSHGRHIIQLLREWLKFQLGSAYVEDEWKVPRTGCAVQNNGYDCGVFVCTNSLCVALGLDTSCYTEPDMTQQRRNIAAVLINRGFVADFAWESSGL